MGRGLDGTTPDLPDIDQEVVVTFRYPVKFTHGLLDPLNRTLRDVVEAEDRARLLVVIDEGVADAHPTMTADVGVYCAAHADALELTAPPLVVPGGEAIKNQSGPVDEIRAAIDVHGVDRHSYVVAIGGGAVLDAVGYAAATAHRGVRLIRVPTTVLAQDDSAVGVKNGINAFGKKNFVGSFAPPHAVLNDFDLLTTLADRDWRAGISEAIKVALLKDAAFFTWIEHHAGDLDERSLAGDGAAGAPQRRAAPEPHRHQRRPVRARLVAAARLRPLGGAQARAALAPRAAPRRGGRRSASRSTRPTATSPAACRTRTGAASSSCSRRSSCRSGIATWPRPAAAAARPCWPGWRSSVSTWEGGSRSCCSSGSARASKCTTLDEAVLLEASDLLRRRVEGGEREGWEPTPALAR